MTTDHHSHDSSHTPPPVPEDATEFAPRDELEEFADEDFDFLEGEPTSASGPVGLLGEYLLMESIGAGGMGQVFRAEHRTMNRQVALKILNDKIAGRRDILEQFYAEIRAVARLMHPNIVTAFDAGSVDETHYLVMELVEGEVLSRQIREHGSLSSSEAVNVLEQAAEALAYAHSMDVIHRDIKPSNMMLSGDGKLKILDFGLAMFSKGGTSKSNSHMFMGTPEYMSPEQIENADSVDARSDLYSLGASLFYLLTGRAMFSGQKMQVATAQLRQRPPALYMVRADVDLRIDAVFQKLVAKKPEDRYESADALLADLREMNLASKPATLSAFRKGGSRLAEDNPTSVAISRSTLARKSRIVAIDLGMLVSTAAYYDATVGPQVIQQGEGNAQHLRNMIYSLGSRIEIGPDAVALRQDDPEHVFHSPQRWIGADQVKWKLAGKRPPPEVVIAAILRQIMSNSTSVTDGGTSAVVTVPGCFDQLHRRAIRTACDIAGIELVQLLDKPLAAALCWLDLNSRLLGSSDQPSNIQSKILVVHLGGSGLEASLIAAENNSVRQLAVHGSWKLGTQRWQHLLGEYFAGVFKEKTGKSIRDDVVAATRMQRTIELAMDRLTRTSKVEVRFDWEGASVSQLVTQEGLVRIAPQQTQAIQDCIAGVCRKSKMDIADVDHVLLCGSLMQVRPIQEIIKRVIPHLDRVEVLEKADIARGASIQAQYLSRLSASETALHATGCASYDIAVLAASAGGAKPKVLIPAGKRLVASFSSGLRPAKDSDGNLVAFPAVQIIEGTHEGGMNWRRLGNVDPAKVFPDRAADDELLLQLEVNESGLLQSSLIWPAGNRQSHLPETSDATLAPADIEAWRHWLETAMLTSIE